LGSEQIFGVNYFISCCLKQSFWSYRPKFLIITIFYLDNELWATKPPVKRQFFFQIVSYLCSPSSEVKGDEGQGQGAIGKKGQEMETNCANIFLPINLKS
jgi:hypothetical protein